MPLKRANGGVVDMFVASLPPGLTFELVQYWLVKFRYVYRLAKKQLVQVMSDCSVVSRRFNFEISVFVAKTFLLGGGRNLFCNCCKSEYCLFRLKQTIPLPVRLPPTFSTPSITQDRLFKQSDFSEAYKCIFRCWTIPYTQRTNTLSALYIWSRAQVM